MLVHYPNGEYWFESELGPDSCGEPRRATEEEAQAWLKQYHASEAQRLIDIETAKAPEFVI
jgi:hypothetical protein